MNPDETDNAGYVCRTVYTGQSAVDSYVPVEFIGSKTPETAFFLKTYAILVRRTL